MKKTTIFAVIAAVLFAVGCGGEPFNDTPMPDSGAGAAGGMAGSSGTGGADGTAATGGSSGSSGEGGMAGSSGTGGAGGEAGDAGVDAEPDAMGGSAGSSGSGGDAGLEADADADIPDSPVEADAPDPCTGMYMELVDVGNGNPIPSASGPVTVAEYDLHGTSSANPLSVTVDLVNNTDDPADFTLPMPTSAAEYVRLRCQEPNGGPSYATACQGDLVGGRAHCENPGCYSLSGGVVRVLLQVKPGASGTFRVAIDPTTVQVCGDQQSLIPQYTVY